MTSRLARSILFLTLFATSSSCGGESRFAEFDATIETFLEENGLAGATAVVVHRERGVLHMRGYGEHDVDRISMLASTSKILSAGVLVRLADQGLLDLDEPISTYLAGWGDHKAGVTVAQLLSNSSGMPGLIDGPTYAPYLCQFYSVDTLSACGMALYQAADAAESVPPDTAFRYGGAQWQLAGSVAEVVSGKTWDELVQETYVDPCGLDVLGYGNHYAQAFFEGGIDSGFAYPTFFGGDPANLYPTDNPNIEGGAYSNVRSYAQILLMHLRGGVCPGGRVLSEAGVARMQEDRIGDVYQGQTIDPTLPGYGLGWWVSRENPDLVVDPGAFGALAWLDVGREYGVVILLESDSTLGAELRQRIEPITAALFDAF